MIEALLYPHILGLGRVESTEPLRRNGVFQHLAGLPRYPATTTLRCFLERFAVAGRDKSIGLHDPWRKELLCRPHLRGTAIFDLDTTVLTVYGRQESAVDGFDPAQRGRPSCLPLFWFEGKTAGILFGSYHPGNTHPSTVIRPLLEDVFGRLPSAVRQVRAPMQRSSIKELSDLSKENRPCW